MTTAIRMALRQFRQHPSFALITILVLGLGVGAATTIYTIVESVVLRPLPYSEPDRLVTIWDTNVGEARLHDRISPVNFSDQRELDVFEDAAAWWRPGVNLIDPGIDPVRVKYDRGQRQPLRSSWSPPADRRWFASRRPAFCQ